MNTQRKYFKYSDWLLKTKFICLKLDFNRFTHASLCSVEVNFYQIYQEVTLIYHERKVKCIDRNIIHR